jgi:pyruvate formate lyase activating enzyme
MHNPFHKAHFWEKKGNLIHCTLCPQDCMIAEGRKGFCKARKNIGGTLFSIVYGKALGLNVDPIEKKPLYHFLPGSLSLSFGTAGCNLACMHCQNHEMSCADPEDMPVNETTPADIVRIAKSKGCQSISYTYNEPTIFLEFAIDCAKLARREGLKNVLVTNGFINPEPSREFCTYMDAANVDLKAFNNDFFVKVTKSRLAPVLEALKIYKGIWLEITNLILSGKNDDMHEIEDMCRWIRDNLGGDVPLHFSRAFPMNKMLDISPTDSQTLISARAIARKYLDYVYVGNIDVGASDTLCPKCGTVVVQRDGYKAVNKLKKNTCQCGYHISGSF